MDFNLYLKLMLFKDYRWRDIIVGVASTQGRGTGTAWVCPSVDHLPPSYSIA